MLTPQHPNSYAIGRVEVTDLILPVVINELNKMKATAARLNRPSVQGLMELDDDPATVDIGFAMARVAPLAAILARWNKPLELVACATGWGARSEELAASAAGLLRFMARTNMATLDIMCSGGAPSPVDSPFDLANPYRYGEKPPVGGYIVRPDDGHPLFVAIRTSVGGIIDHRLAKAVGGVLSTV
jgi:hypothetical protein